MVLEGAKVRRSAWDVLRDVFVSTGSAWSVSLLQLVVVRPESVGRDCGEAGGHTVVLPQIGSPDESRLVGVAGERRVIKSRFGSLVEWSEWVAANARPSKGDGNRTVLVGSGGRPATREELVRFVAEQNARFAREHGKV